MRLLLSFVTSAALFAQDTIGAGVPLRIAIENRIRIQSPGQAVQGRLVEPVYVFDHIALPAGTLVEGRIASIGGVPTSRRIAATMSGNFTPAREVRAEFDTVILNDGSRIPVHTTAVMGAANTARVAKKGVKDRFVGMERAAILAFKTPDKWTRLQARLTSMLPYHRQAWQPGTLFNATLQQSVLAPRREYAMTRESGELHARLLQPLSSASARKGEAIEAVVTRPLFSADGKLLAPEGTKLVGEVMDARPARLLHRNGKLHFVFRQIKPADGQERKIQGYLEGLDADAAANLALDSEGAARISSPKTRFIFPAIAAGAAALSFHQDYNAQGIPDQDYWGRAQSGVVGLGLVGMVVAQAARPLASGIAIAGAGFSIYNTFIARGSEVTLPANTPVRVSMGERRRTAP